MGVKNKVRVHSRDRRKAKTSRWRREGKVRMSGNRVAHGANGPTFRLDVSDPQNRMGVKIVKRRKPRIGVGCVVLL